MHVSHGTTTARLHGPRLFSGLRCQHNDGFPIPQRQRQHGLVPFYLPIALYYAFTPQRETHFYNLLFNINSGDAVMIEYNKTRSNDSNDLMNSQVYDAVYQIKSTRNK